MNTQSPYARPFTFRELLSHTAGYPTYFADGSSDLETSFKTNGTQPLWSPPGVVFNYSNAGFALAGLALQKATGEEFGSLIEKHVFGPAGMTGARMSAAKVLAEGNFAYGHSDAGELKPTDSYYASTYYGPMGGAWAGAEDLAKFARVFLDGGAPLLDAKSYTAMTTERTATGWSGEGYGLGLFIEHYEGGVTAWTHSGSVGGFLSEFFVVPSAGFAVVTLVNSNNDLPYLRDDGYQSFVGKTLVPIYGQAPKASDLAEQAGTYASAKLGSLKVEKIGEALTLVFSDGTKTAMTASGTRDVYSFAAPDGFEDTAFFWRVSGAVRFLVSGSGVGERK